MGDPFDHVLGALVYDLDNNLVGEVMGGDDLQSGDVTLNVRPVRCIGCRENDAPVEGLPTYRLCATCMDDAFTYIVLRDLVAFLIEDGDERIANAIDHLDSIDARARARGGQHIDAHASAWDSIAGTSYMDVRDRVFTLLQRAMHDHVMIPNP